MMTSHSVITQCFILIINDKVTLNNRYVEKKLSKCS